MSAFQFNILSSYFKISEPSDNTFEVFPYNAENLAKALSNEFITPQNVKTRKRDHYHYFLDYLGDTKDGIEAKTIVIENKYLSKSYLQDFSNFYSNCYVNYKRFCKRVHFFSTRFSKEKITNCLLSPQANDDRIWTSYLGYIVIRPLPQASIGATLLKTFASKESGRQYNAIREYSINLFGKTLKLDSLVFQEQDNVVGACASSALWSAFHKVSIQDVFQTQLYSPSQITKSVKNKFNDFSGRVFPNHGLQINQICEVIDSLGLVSELSFNISLKIKNRLKALIYAYNKMGLPVLLVIKFPDDSYHLLTVVGYRIGINKSTKILDGVTLLSNNISKFYAHDDQVGPFARLEFTNGKKFPLKTAWLDFEKKDKRGNYTNIPASPEGIIIPIHDEIKINFDDVHKQINVINQFFKLIVIENIDWEIFLDFSNKYKETLFENSSIPPNIRKKILLISIPKYIWIAKAFIENECIMEIVFDGTNIATSDFCKFINIYNNDLKRLLKEILLDKKTGAEELFKQRLSIKYFQLFKNELL